MVELATITPYKDKNGNIVSYQIQVYSGRDANGKKLKPFTTSWKVPDTYKSEKAIKRALDKFVSEFETSCKRGEVSPIKKPGVKNHLLMLKNRIIILTKKLPTNQD